MPACLWQVPEPEDPALQCVLVNSLPRREDEHDDAIHDEGVNI